MKQDTQAIFATQSEAKPTAKKFNLQEKLALCKQWYGSGLRKSEVARKHNIKPELFTHWTNVLVQKYLPKNALHGCRSHTDRITLRNTFTFTSNLTCLIGLREVNYGCKSRLHISPSPKIV